MDLAERIININEYRLVGTADDYTATINAIAERVEREGHPGVLGYHFYVNEAGGTAGATIIYADAQAWLEHHQMLRSWRRCPASARRSSSSARSSSAPSVTRCGSTSGLTPCSPTTANLRPDSSEATSPPGDDDQPGPPP